MMPKYLIVSEQNPREDDRLWLTVFAERTKQIFAFEFVARNDTNALKQLRGLNDGHRVFRKVVSEKKVAKMPVKKKTRPTKMGVRRKTKEGSTPSVEKVDPSRCRQEMDGALLKRVELRQVGYSPDEVPKKKTRKKVRPMKMGKRRSPRGK